MDRHNNFTNIPYLDSELDLILRQADELIGRETEHLPPVNQVPDRSRFFIRRADRSWKHYIKLHNSYQALLNYAENLGTGEGRVFKEISDGSLQLRSIKAGLNVSVSEDEDNNILIQSTGTIEELGYTPEDSANKSDDDSLGSSSILYPTQGAVKSYVDAGLSGKADTVHNHVEADITDLDKYTQSEVDSLLSGKADTGHTHDDRYYTETELDGGQLNNLYYTETEVDTLLSGKANTSHTHVEADITDLGSYIEDITEESLSDLQDVTITSIASGEILKWNGTAWINNTLAEAGISATGHTHDDRYYTETETDTLLSGKANTSHTHVEADITDLGNYSVVGHTHVEADITDLGSYLTDITGESIDDLADVDPANKADGRILQYNQSSGNLEYVEPTAGSVSELNDLSDVGDSTPTNRNVLVADGDSWESRALTEADISDLGNYSIVGHTHDDRYYTETEVDTLLSGKADTSHVHSAADITSGTLAIGRGGTGVTSLGTLSKTNDTNVTLTLGGTPSNSLIQSVSLTLGWAGQLAVARGGTGQSTLTANKVLVGNGTSGILQPTNLHWDNINSRLGIGAISPSAKVHAIYNGVSINSVSTLNDGIIIQALTGGRSLTSGAQLEFAIPAKTDGSNSYGQGRIITVAGNTNNNNATGKMILGVKRFFDKTGAGTNWYYDDLLTLDGSDSKVKVLRDVEVTGDIIQDDIIRPFFSLAHPTIDIEDITITINKFDNTASANDRMMVHWWVSTTQFGSPNHTGTTGVSYTLGAGESSITSYNHAITDGNRQIKIRLIRNTGQPSITLYLMCEVQGIVFASDSFTIIGV